jgi:hypothetical protein
MQRAQEGGRYLAEDAALRVLLVSGLPGKDCACGLQAGPSLASQLNGLGEAHGEVHASLSGGEGPWARLCLQGGVLTQQGRGTGQRALGFSGAACGLEQGRGALPGQGQGFFEVEL